MSAPPLRAKPDGCLLNRRLGWLLLGLGFLGAALIDPWALTAAGAEAPFRLAAREAQGVVLAMGLLQLLVAQLAARGSAARTLTAAGALLYAGGHVLRLFMPAGGWLVPLGAVLNAVAVVLLLRTARRDGRDWTTLVALGALALGMVLDAAAGLAFLFPHGLSPYLGPEAGIRRRMLRLARVAAIALPAQAFLFHDLQRTLPRRGWVEWGGRALALGAAGMPALLIAAALGDLRLKYLLPLPADAILFGAGTAVWLAFRRGTVPERVGWTLLLASMLLGEALGGFAFDGPLPAPGGFTHYLDPARSLTRIGHAYAIVLALMLLFAREDGRPPSRGGELLMVGVLISLGLLVLVAVAGVPPGWLAPGPALVAVAAIGLGARKVPE